MSAAVLPDDLVEDIAVHLDDAGEYRVTLPPGPMQRVIDLRWAALTVERRLGRPVVVDVIRAGTDPTSMPLTVRMTCSRVRATIPPQRDPAL
jgi:hypothetical protein